MEYSLIISIIFYICGFFYMAFGTYTLDTNANSYVNRLFILLMSSMAIWSFSHSIANSAPTAEISEFWRCFSVFGWGIFYSLLLHFVLIFTKTETRLNRNILLIIIYLPSLINLILFAPFGYLADKQYQLIQTDFGWINTMPMNPSNAWFIAYYSTFIIASIVLLIRWWAKIEPNTPLKRQASYLLMSILLPLFLGVTTETLPEILEINFYPKMVIVFLMIPVTTLFFASKKSGLLLERKRPLASVLMRIDQYTDDDRRRLFKTVAGVFTAGSAVSFFIGYFAMKRPVGDEILLAATLLSLGIFIRSIPRITKNLNIQNTLFLAAGILSLFHLMIRNAETGAATIWSIYILFFMFTVILNSKLHLTIYAVLVIIIQIAFSIIHPKVSVIVDINEYMTRIALVTLTFVAVRRLADEYTLKLEVHKKFIKEQKVLESISTNFISVNTENVKEKVDEMLKMADEVLEFDHAYLIGFSEDYEDANVFSTYTKNLENESFPYHPGMKLKTAALPIAKTLIDEAAAVICEDVENTPPGECESAKNLLLSRGINSFYALPLTMQEEEQQQQHIDGMLVIEYYDRSKENLRESRSYFLNMIVNMLRDTRKKTLYEEILYNVAYFDETTKLANRNMLIKTLEQNIYDIKESGKIAVLNIELENVRMIKDTFGHNVIEHVMMKSATMLKNLLSKDCNISRTSEGEFVIVLPNVENSEKINECAEKLLHAFSHPIATDLGIEALFVIARIGIAVYPDDGRDANTLLKNVDLAVYEAKSTNEKIVFYAERLESHIAETTLFTNRLFKSLQNKEFFLEFQPQISCDTGKIIGVEALLRWVSDGNKIVPPVRFIPILEQTGLIYDVGLWVLEQSLKEHHRLIAKGFPPLRFSINLSVIQFEEENFIPDFKRIIEESRVDPKYIELEITESLFSENTADVIKKLYTLKEMGVSIAIDDFGKGYSSLNRLKLVPFDRIKIDKELIDYIDVERKLAPLTKIIILLARTFKASVTAEGVETKEQADFLKSIDCDEIQGYYFSRPLSVEALEEFIKKES